MPASRHTALSAALAVLAGLLLAAGGVLHYVQAELTDSRAFGARLSSSLRDRAVHDEIARRLLETTVHRTSGDVLAVRPLASTAIDALVGSAPFAQIAADASAEAHRALLAGDARIVVRLDGVPALAAAKLLPISPRLAARAAASEPPVVATLPAGNIELQTVRRLLDASAAGVWLLAGAALAAGAALLLAPDRRRSAAWLGIAAAGAGLLVAVLVTAGGLLAPGGAAGRAIWEALFGDLRWAALVVLAGGVATALLSGGLPRRERVRAVHSRALVVGAGVAFVAAGLAAVAIARDVPSVPQAVAKGCNGSVALCSRRLNDVVFAGTHNSYAAADEPGWLFANQRRGIARQLGDGIRALLIDVHHGVLDPATELVRTDLQADGTSRNKVAVALGPEGLRAAQRLAGDLGATPPAGPRSLYLCHTLCELGSEPLGTELNVIRDFLETHPRAVLILVVEPYVTPREIEGAFREAGLLRYVAQLHRSAPLPTLGTLVDTGRRLVVFAEQDGGEPAWYMPAFSFIQDTPLDGAGPGRTSCALFRGAPGDPILLINHWNTEFPPRASLNAQIGTAAALRARVRECERAGRPAPGILAVDFYERSAVLAVTDELNAAR